MVRTLAVVMVLAAIAGPAMAQEAPGGGDGSHGAPAAAAAMPPPGQPAQAPAVAPAPTPFAAQPPAVAPLAPVVAERPPEPSTGTALLVLGGLGLAGGVAEFAFMPLCLAGRIPSSQHGDCLGVSGAAGAIMLGVGVPLTIIGAKRRATWQGWRVGYVPGGASATWSRSW